MLSVLLHMSMFSIKSYIHVYSLKHVLLVDCRTMRRQSLHLCVDDTDGSDANIGVIVSCVVGSCVCILIIAISIFLIISNRRQATLDKQRQRILADRMQRVWSVVSGQWLQASVTAGVDPISSLSVHSWPPHDFDRLRVIIFLPK